MKYVSPINCIYLVVHAFKNQILKKSIDKSDQNFNTNTILSTYDLISKAIHTGKNCREYQELSKETDQESKSTVAMLKEMVDRGEALACPTCAAVLTKNWGCDWLICSMCKTEICWVTRGPRWGPGVSVKFFFSYNL